LCGDRNYVCSTSQSTIQWVTLLHCSPRFTPVHSPVWITNWNIWSMILTFDPELKVTNLIFVVSFSRILYDAIVSTINQAAQNLSHNKISDPWLDFWSCDQGHKICFLRNTVYSFYMVKYLAKSVKPIRIYHNLKYLTSGSRSQNLAF